MPAAFQFDEFIRSRSRASPGVPRRILAIRLQAMGDVVITLPYLQYLRRQYPETRLDLLTREESAEIPRSLNLFDKVYAIGGGRNFRKQYALTWLMLPRLILQRYDMVLDLQNNEISRLVRKSIRPLAWSEFDRFSTRAAGERTRLTIAAAGLEALATFGFSTTHDAAAQQILINAGWQQEEPLLILNPAGAFTTRNWPQENYLRFAELWTTHFPSTRFLVLGTSFIEKKAAYLEQQLGERLINLAGKTNPAEAFAIVQKTQMVLSEDSGLMHMAWTSGIPTLALFGGTRSDWARPLGEHTAFLDSSDLECGNCMLAECKWGDTRCLTRYSGEQVFELALSLYKKSSIKKSGTLLNVAF